MAIDSGKARAKIESLRDLPTLPSVVGEIIAMANSPKTNAADVGRMIEHDQALTAKVLKLVNSSFYGFPGQIKSVQHAVVIIGFNKVKNVVMTASVFDLSKGRSSDQLDIPRFWEHCLGTAIAAKVVTKWLRSDLLPEDAFLGGLIHDLGKLILCLCLKDEYAPAIALTQRDKILLREAEKEVLGFDHTTSGTWIAEKWRLPSPLLNAIRHHHTPLNAREDREMVSAVHIGDVLARALGIGHPGDERMCEIHPGVLQHYGLQVDFLDEALGTILAEMRMAKEFFDLIEK